MSRTPPDLEGLIYDGVFEETPWSSFLEQLKTTLRADYAGFVFRSTDGAPYSHTELYSGTRASAALQRQYVQEIRQQDPLPYLDLREGLAYRTSSLLDLERKEHHSFHRDFLVPSGMPWMMIIRVAEPSGVNAWLFVGRGSKDFSETEMGVANDLSLAIRRALRMLVGIEREKFRAYVTDTAVQRLNFEWVSLDAGGRVIETSRPAKSLWPRYGNVLQVTRGGRLTTSHSVKNGELKQLIDSFAKNPEERPRALRVSSDPWVEILLVPVRNKVTPSNSVPVAVAYIQGDNGLTADRHEQLAELFGLLPSEARLALALCRGRSIVEAASELNITEGTARHYSKLIYGKTGARGQADLVRIILGSVLAIA